MDLRVEKTRAAIINAFLALRAKKPLEKITVKELCALARINKSTFYTHFADLYALADALETEVVASILAGIAHPELAFEQPARFTEELFLAYHAQSALLNTLFSGSRSGRLVGKLEEGLKALIFARRPAYRGRPVPDIVLSYLIYGGYYAYTNNRAYDPGLAASVVGRLAQQAKALLDDEAAAQGPQGAGRAAENCGSTTQGN